MKSLLALCLLTGFAVAQEEDATAPAEEPIDGLLHRETEEEGRDKAALIFLRGIYYGEADVDDGPGDVQVKEWGIGGWHRWPLIGGHGSLGGSVRYGNRKYDWGDGGGLAGVADPFDHVEDLRLTGFYEAGITEEWAWFGAATLAAGREDDADFDDGVYAEGAAGFTFQVQQEMQLGLEVIGYTEIEDDPSVYVFPVVQWTINEDSRISTVTDSTDPTIAYFFDFTDELSSYFGAGVKIRQYSLDDDVLPSDSALKDREYALRGGVLWSRDKFLVDGYIGLAARELTLDSDDSQLDKDDIDPTPFLGFTASYGFY